MTGQQRTSAVHAFELELPAAVKDAYYRDDVGNVSTSNLRLLKSKSLLELRPRFPLFGGWNYNWYHGYNLNLWDFVSFVTGDSATHSMEIDLVQGVKNVPIDKLKMKIVLPEGAK